MNYYIKRFFAFFIDLALAGAISVFLNFFSSFIDINEDWSNSMSSLGLIFFFCKDLIFLRKGSIGKQIFKINIVFSSASFFYLRLFIRNITLVLWPLEGVLVLLFKKRLGDFLTGGRVVEN